jgi:glutamate-1-semialdehyde 2,1-aminomutase
MRPKLLRKTLRTVQSNKLFTKARTILPGGVNSPVRAFKAVGRRPVFIKKASAAFLWDEDHNKYIDYVGSWGPMILGHANPAILKSIRTALRSGTSFGAPTRMEIKLAELIVKSVPSIEMVRMVSSGTEAILSVLQLARAFSGKDKIIKFEGCCHGHTDEFLIKAGSGIPAAAAADTLTASYNDLQSVRTLFEQNANQVAAVIIEPIASSMGCVPPQPGFLEGLRTLCTEQKVLLIFDEGTTGFRVALGGAQQLYGITPDLTTLGKIIGGGLPVGAYGGKKEIMELVAPSGPVYQVGTLSGNPIAMAAGFQTLKILSSNTMIYKRLEQRAAQLEEGLRENLRRLGLAYTINRTGSMFTLFFTDKPVVDYTSALKTDTGIFRKYFNAMLEQGVYLPPSQFESAFLSTAHSDRIIQKTVAANYRALQK